MNLQGKPIRVGDVIHRGERPVTEEVRDFHLATFCDTSPVFREAGDPAPAPPLVYHSEVYEHVERWYLRNLVGNLHARQEWFLYAPPCVGRSVFTRAMIAERYRRRNRDYVVNEVDYCDADGNLLVRGRTHQSFLTDEPEPQAGFVVDRAKQQAKQRRPLGEGPGRALEPLELLVSEETCWRFSGPGKNYHTDADAARKLGFPEIVVQGMLSTCLVSQLMAREYGAGWLWGGRMDVKLVNVLWAGERVRTCARESDSVPEGTGERRTLDVWVEKEDRDRTPVIVGSASVLAG